MERTLTAKGRATRQRIVEGAATEMRRVGAANVSLDDVRAATCTSKSQLFHYFPGGRDELLVAVARHESDRVLADQQPFLDDLTSWKAWRAWRDAVVERYRAQGRACPLSVLVGAVGRDTPAGRAIVIDLYETWQRKLADGVRHMQAAGKMPADVDPDETAAALLAAIQGGVVIMLATGEVTHLSAALDLALDSLRP
jgi:AcrR family transcriptional regulator